MPAHNPYKTMLLTFQPQYVYGWEEIIKSILTLITQDAPSSHGVYGIRAMGKSTFLKFLKHPQGATQRYSSALVGHFSRGGTRKLLWVYVNFHQLEAETHIFFLMYESLYNEIDQQNLDYIDIMPPDRNADRTDMAHQLRDVCKRLNEDYNLRTVFLMDDFDIPLLAKQVDRADEVLLRTVSGMACLIITTDKPFNEVRPDDGLDSPLLGILRPDAIGLITEHEARQLIVQPAADVDVTYLPAELEMLIEVGGRVPFLLVATCEEYFNLRAEIIDIEPTFSNPNLRRNLQSQLTNRLLVQPHVTNVLNRMWSRHAEQHNTLIEMAQNSNKGIRGAEAEALAQRGLAYWDNKLGGNRLFSSLFTDFIRKQLKIEETTNNPEDYDFALFTSKLSPIDRAVFEYLTAHEGEICTFEALAEHVWQQDIDKVKRALEAAVHRLRRELAAQGIDHLINNVRGQGYEYVVPHREKV